MSGDFDGDSEMISRCIVPRRERETSYVERITDYIARQWIASSDVTVGRL